MFIDACVVRQQKAYPVYDESYADHMAMIRRDLARRYPSLHLVGRNGMHKYNNQDHAMMTGHAHRRRTSSPASRSTTSGRSTRTPNMARRVCRVRRRR